MSVLEASVLEASVLKAGSRYAPDEPPGAPAIGLPRPLGLRRALVWTVLGLVAALLVVVSIIVIALVWNDVRPAQALSESQMTDVAQAAANVGFLAFVGVIAAGCRRAGWRAADYFALTRPQGHYLLLGAAVLVASLGVVIGLAYLDFSLAADGDTPSTITSLVITLIAVAVVAPIWEELIFRGFLYRTFAATRLGVAGTIILTSLLWAGLHIDKTWLGLGETFFCGLLYGWLRRRAGSTLVSMGVHFLNNSIAGLALAGIALGWWS